MDRLVHGGHDQHANRHRPDADDVPALRQGALRRLARRLPRPQGTRAVAGAELDRRAGADVCAGADLPARQARIHGRPDHDRPSALHRDGDRLERDRQGFHRVRRRAGGLQFDLPGAVLQRLCLVLHHRAAADVRPGRLGGRRLDRPDRRERVHLPRHPLPGRHAHARDHAALRVQASGTTSASCRRSGRSR